MSSSGINIAARLEAERKLKEGISGHPTGLPKRLLELFAPLDPLKTLTAFKQKPPKLPTSGMAWCVGMFAEPGDPEYEPPRPADLPTERRFRNPELDSQARVDKESKAEKVSRIIKDKAAKGEAQIEAGVEEWDPSKDPNAQGDPFKTLFVGRLSYEVTEKKLRREFEEYGPIKRIRLVLDKNASKPRGYAFIEFEHKDDMKTAYKMADGRKIEGRRVLVDVERGRTVPNWRPRRLGGGKGGEARLPKEPKDPSKRALAGLAPGAPAAPIAAPAPPPARPPPREVEKAPSSIPGRPPPREERREREPEPRERERERERDREKERGEREREKERPRERDRGGDREERDRDRKRERDGGGRDGGGRDGERSKRPRDDEHTRGRGRRERDI